MNARVPASEGMPAGGPRAAASMGTDAGGPPAAASVGIDVGGTFTDLVVVHGDGTVSAGKVSSTPDDQSVGVANALRTAAPPGDRVARVVHGTTVVTNTLLERSGARVVLCATEGATDLLELRRQERAALYDLAAQHPPPLVEPADVVAVPERVVPQGVLRALDEAGCASVAAAVAARGGDVVAVSLLHAYAEPAHERRLAAALRERLPGCDVICSSDVLPEIREYERTTTTTCEAYVRPRAARYLDRLVDAFHALGYPAPMVMASGGGTAPVDRAARAAASLALSGPAGGVTGAAFVARAAGISQALTIDIGGTSADVGLILDGEPLLESGGSVAGVPIALPRVLVETVSAGGGSIAWVDDGGALRVGPRSAGARPGPVAFARGGTLPTVTDAHVALDNIRATHMSDGVALDRAGAGAAVAALAARLGATAERTAQAIVETADAAMARALRRVSVERGVDPRRCALVAFGGGGPLHACALADRLGVTRVLVPPFAGVLSALGLAIAPARAMALGSLMRLAGACDAETLGAAFTALRDGLSGAEGGEERRTVRARYAGQGHELDVSLDAGAGGAEAARRFAAAHQARYGFTLDRPVELVSARLARTGAPHDAVLRRAGEPIWRDDRRRDDGSPCDAAVHGRATIELPDATLLVAAGWMARALPIGGWLLERDA